MYRAGSSRSEAASARRSPGMALAAATSHMSLNTARAARRTCARLFFDGSRCVHKWTYLERFSPYLRPSPQLGH